jgi:hypothetical protein
MFEAGETVTILHCCMLDQIVSIHRTNAGRVLLRPDNAIAETRVLAIVDFGSWMKRHDQVVGSAISECVFNK